MTALDRAQLNLSAALQLQSLVRTESASVRAEAAKAVLEARRDLAAVRARMAMRKDGRAVS